MATNTIVSGSSAQVSSAITGPAPAATTADKGMIAGNFQTFLQLLTTQLKNQNPLDPLDTNQFTQQLVQFAQVEQQLRSNDQLSTLVSMQQTAQQSQALAFVGATVAVDGSTTPLKNGTATWTFNAPKPASATVTIANSTGQTVYSGNFTVQAGQQDFVWDGRGSDGTLWPEGSYKMTITAKDASGQALAISTEVQGRVDSVDLTQNPPLLSVDGLNFAISQIRRVIRGAS
jgi:flagellar basal-body rod modification protein FlgD